MKRTLAKRIFAAFIFLSGIYILTLPVHRLTISSSSGGLLFNFPAPACFSFILRFMHSVEQTPVETEYMVSAGKIRQWEERVKSHNAGLPFKASTWGKFLSDGDWMRFRGGGAVFKSIRYRVGNAQNGRNSLIIESDEIKLYALFPGKALLIRVEQESQAARAVRAILTVCRGMDPEL